MKEICVVDVSKIGLLTKDPTKVELETVGNQLRLAFSKIGFVYLSGHGIAESEIEDAMKVSKEFFELEEVKKYSVSRPSPLARDGWVAPGRETFIENNAENVHELREAFDINGFNEDARFPNNIPAFKTNLMDLAKRTVKLSERLLKCISLTLGRPENFFTNLHSRVLGGKNASALCTLYYPAMQGIPPEGHVRCSEHGDYGTFTLLFQDQYPGLRVRFANFGFHRFSSQYWVKSPSGQWISAKPIPGTILVNIGDLLEMWTGGLFPATRHRMIIPEEEVLKSVPRQSIVFFVHPDNDVVVEPVDSDAKDYSAVVALDRVQRRFSETNQF